MVIMGPEVAELETPDGWCERAVDEVVSTKHTDAAAEHRVL
jgi:hypothetical protein